MNKDMEVYRNLDGLKEKEDTAKEYLVLMKERYTLRTNFMRSSCEDLSLQYHEMKSELDDSKTWQSLVQYEEKIRRQGQVIYALKEFIQKKGKEAEYKTIRTECIKIMNDFALKSSSQ